MNTPSLLKRLLLLSLILLIILLIMIFMGLSAGSSSSSPQILFRILTNPEASDQMLSAIVSKIRLPRVFSAVLVGAALSLGGLVFQAILRNPLAEPYILGISGGSAVGAILGILMGLSRFPGVTLTAFTGSMTTLFLILLISSGHTTVVKKDSLLLSGVMVNAFCTSLITFLLSMTRDTELHSIIFWLMGDLSSADMRQVTILTAVAIPCFIVIFLMTHTMNILLMGKETAMSMGVNVKNSIIILLVASSLMIGAVVCHSGLLGFVGLVIPHLLRIIVGHDHRLLAPACVLGGGAYMVLCDLLARTLPNQGEIPVGVITAMIGAPLFIVLLKKAK